MKSQNMLIYANALAVFLFLHSIAIAQPSQPNDSHESKARIEETSTMDVLIMKPDKTTTEKPSPILIFLKGFLPTVGIAGYTHLLKHLTDQGLIIIAPIYRPDIHYSLREDLLESKAMSENGFNSETIAKDIIEAIDPFLTKYSSNPVVLYGHSMGGRIAILLAHKLGNRIKGIMLDGIMPQIGRDSSGQVVSEDTTNICETNTLRELPYPTTFVYYELDKKLSPSVLDAYNCVKTPFKQLMEIQSFEDSNGVLASADHFSPLTTEPIGITIFFSLHPRILLPINYLAGVRALLVAPAVKDIHGYELNIVLNEVDQYGLMSLLPALAYAHSPEHGDRHEKGWSVIYGKERNFFANDQMLRELIDEEGSLLQ